METMDPFSEPPQISGLSNPAAVNAPPTTLNSALSDRPVLTADKIGNLELQQHDSSNPSAPVDPDANVIIEDPNSNENVEDEADGEEVETEESFMIVEEALAGAGLRDASGFSLKFEKLAVCCPQLSIRPNVQLGEFTMRAGGVEITTTSKSGCFCCCGPRSSSWQTITILKNGMDMMNFVYRPQFWCFSGKKERIADIYIPQRNRRIGWIKYNDNFENGAIIVDSVTKTLFLMKKIKSETDAMMMYTNFGIPAACAQATRGIRVRGFITWTDFEMKYTPAVTSSSSSVKGVLMAAFALWVLTNRERRIRWRFVFLLAAIVVGLLIGFLIGYLQDSKN